MRTSFAPNTCVPRILAGSRSAAARAATAFARLPVEEQATVLKPKLRALAKATATTRSLKLNEGRQTASFFRKRCLVPISLARRGAFSSGVKPAGKLGS